MITALAAAIGEIFEPRVRRTLILGLVLAILILGGLVLGFGALLHNAGFAHSWAIGPALAVLGDIAMLVLAWLLFPAVATTVIGFFLEDALRAVEARRYPFLSAPRRQSFGEQAKSGFRIALLGIAINLLALPLYLLLPGLNLVLFYGLNGWLMGREYFELIALRRLDERQLRQVWRLYWPRLVLAGVVIAFLLTLPLVNLAAPLIAALFMLHLFERLRQGEPARDYSLTA